ncbi:MAG: DNA polymerase III subunit delta [Bacteroidales bacterium]|jgi:DNA polymerase-3 subunit delta|nr:DNA polymerase III subunit delta [Bacteroidales bacterium]
MTYKELIASFDKKEYAPIYLLRGEEPYFIDKVARYIEEHFFKDESAKDFNLSLLYGMDTTAAQVVSFAKEYPMMSDYRLVIVREAQNLQDIYQKSRKKIDNLEELIEYAKHPQKQTVLVLCHKDKEKTSGTTTFQKTIKENGVVFESKRIYDNQLPDHIKAIAKEKRFVIADNEVKLLATNIGNNLSRIDNELEKLHNIVPPNGAITAKIIEDYIGISKEYNVFELVTSVIACDEAKAYKILTYLASTNPDDFAKMPTISTLYAAFYRLLQYHFAVDKSKEFLKTLGVFWTDVNVYYAASYVYSVAKIKTIMHLLRQYDLMSKGASGNDTKKHELIKELIFKIFQVSKARNR